MKRLFAAALAAILILSLFAAAEFGGIVSGVDSDMAYDQMIIAYEMNQFEQALKILEENRLAEKGYRDSAMYEIYLNARICLENEDYEAAEKNLFGIKDISFLDSAQYWNYAKGRICEINQDYASAIAFYTQASGVEDSSKRIISCSELMTEQQKKSAQALYEAAVEAADVEKLLAAKALFVGLNDNVMAAACDSKIAEIEKKQVYTENVKLFTKACEEKNLTALNELLQYFLAQGDYEDCKTLAESARIMIENISRILIANVTETSADTLRILLKDSSAVISEYKVTYKPLNMKTEETLFVQGTDILLQNLLPGTEYSIQISVRDNPGCLTEIAAKTKDAAAYRENSFRIDRSSLLSIQKAFLAYATMEEIWQKFPDKVQYYDEFQIILNDGEMFTQPSMYVYSFTYSHSQEITEPIRVKWILRSKSGGVFVGTETEYPSLPVRGRIYTDLENILNPVYLELGSWPEETLTLEMYINDMLAGKGAITLGK